MDSDYTITREGESEGALVLHQGARAAGRLDFHADERVIEIDYVVVDPALRGKGLGVRLVDEAVSWARETKRSVRPLCGYAARVMQRNRNYQDVLAARG